MLDFDINREGVTPKDAATLILVREGSGLEVFCVERNRKLKFMGGAIVFPGGKLDDADRDPAWQARTTAPHPRGMSFAPNADALRALAVAACRESLEEAAILPIQGGALTKDDLASLRKTSEAMRAHLEARGLTLDLAALHPLARWITPAAESRRFDARFFLAAAPEGQPGAHDESETMASFWDTPSRVLSRFDAGEVQLAPPTHRTLEVLAQSKTIDDALSRAARASLDPICPRLVQQKDTMALVLPGDPEHDVKEERVPGTSRFVLREGRWRPEPPPHPCP